MNLFVRLFNVISTIYLFVINYLQFLIIFFSIGVRTDPRPKQSYSQDISGSMTCSNKIPTAVPMFSGSENSLVILPSVQDVSGSQKSNMADRKPEVVISLQVEV